MWASAATRSASRAPRSTGRYERCSARSASPTVPWKAGTRSFTPRPATSKTSLPGQGVAVRVQARRGKADQVVPHPHPGAVEHLRAVHDPHDEPGHVVPALAVEARHLRRFPTQERAAVLAAALGDAGDHRGQHRGVEAPGGHVVEEEQGPRPLHEDVVDAVVHEVAPHRVVHAGQGRHLELRPHAVGRGHEDGLRHPLQVGGEEAPEGAEVGEHPRRAGGHESVLDAAEGLVLGVDVHARVAVGEPFLPLHPSSSFGPPRAGRQARGCGRAT
jgi:hypothetical protein